MLSIEPTSQRRHAAARSRTATALLSVGGFLGIIGSLAASRTAGSTSTASTPASNVPAAPAPASTTPATTTTHARRVAPAGDDAPAPAVVPVAPAPVASTAPPASNNQWNYGGTPATTFNQQPVTRSHASR
jgi:hypothetical protein